MKKQKKIRNIVCLHDAVTYNKHHDKDYLVRDGIIIIEYEDYSRSILNSECGCDITNCDYLDIKIIKGKTKVTYIFKEEQF